MDSANMIISPCRRAGGLVSQVAIAIGFGRDSRDTD